MPSSQGIVDYLVESKYRLTTARKAVVEFFSDSKYPFSAQELLIHLKKRGIRVNKTTVYRELEFLREMGIIAEIEFGDRKKRYELASLHHHHHFICMNCGRVENLESPEGLDKIEKRMANAKDLKILRHSLEFFGLCGRCK